MIEDVTRAIDAAERARENLYEAHLRGAGDSRLAVLRARVRQAERQAHEEA